MRDRLPDISKVMTKPNETHPTERLARFDAAFRDHYDVVRRHASRSGSVDCDDIAAECFAALWRRLDSVTLGLERAWLLGASRKLTANERRSARRRDALSEEIGANTVDAPADPSELTGSTDPLVERVLGMLSAGDREILLLEAWDGLDRAEIAHMIGLTRAAAAVRLHRARWRFRQEYERSCHLLTVPAPTTTGGVDVS